MSTHKQTKSYFGSNSNAIFGAPGTDPYADFDIFNKQARLWLQSMEGMTVHEGWSTKMHAIVFGHAYEKWPEPPTPGPGTKASVINLYTVAEKRWATKNRSMRTFIDQDFLNATDPAIHDVICQMEGGHNLGTTNSDAQAIFDKVESKYGQTDDRALQSHHYEGSHEGRICQSI